MLYTNKQNQIVKKTIDRMQFFNTGIDCTCLQIWAEMLFEQIVIP